MDVWQDHWFVCDRCKVKWCVGANLFSNPDEVDVVEMSRVNAEKLAGYAAVEPVRPAWAFATADPSPDLADIPF